METTEAKPPRKFPPPCWTQQEALALIEAYRERWYALRRGYLRTADWEAVAEEVARRCPDASPAKTSAQCRHKMEKLRQRYRAEKQRSLSFPGRFLSSWFYFDNMEAMENGSSPTEVSNQGADDQSNSGNGSRLKKLIDHSLMSLKSNSKEYKQINDYSNTNSVFDNRGIDQNLTPLLYKVKNFNHSDGKPSINYGSGALNGYSSYLDVGSDYCTQSDVDFGGGFRVKNSADGNPVPPSFKAKKFGEVFENLKSRFNCDSEGGSGLNVGVGYCVNNAIDKDSVVSGFRSKKIGKIDGSLSPNYVRGECNESDNDDGFWVKVRHGSNLVGLRLNNGGKADGNWNSNVESGTPNGFSSSLRQGLGKSSDGGGVKRGRSPVEEMVSSIKFLGEGFMKMEKMKMEMSREIEQRRMEMELKRSQLILESQKQIVQAFVKGLLEFKNIKTTKSSE